MMYLPDICSEIDVHLGVARKCGLAKGHDGEHRAVCWACGYNVPRGSDGWHRCQSTVGWRWRST